MVVQLPKLIIPILHVVLVQLPVRFQRVLALVQKWQFHVEIVQHTQAIQLLILTSNSLDVAISLLHNQFNKITVLILVEVGLKRSFYHTSIPIIIHLIVLEVIPSITFHSVVMEIPTMILPHTTILTLKFPNPNTPLVLRIPTFPSESALFFLPSRSLFS